MRRADNLTTFMCRLSWNLGASISWNPQGQSKPVMGLIFLPVFVQVVILTLISVLQAGNPNHMKMVKDMGIAILTLPDGRVQLLHTFSNVSCHTEVFVKQEDYRSMCCSKDEVKKQLCTYIWYVIFW